MKHATNLVVREIWLGDLSKSHESVSVQKKENKPAGFRGLGKTRCLQERVAGVGPMPKIKLQLSVLSCPSQCPNGDLQGNSIPYAIKCQTDFSPVRHTCQTPSPRSLRRISPTRARARASSNATMRCSMNRNNRLHAASPTRLATPHLPQPLTDSIPHAADNSYSGQMPGIYTMGLQGIILRTLQ